MGAREISIAVTPDGLVPPRIPRVFVSKVFRLADAIARGRDDKLYFTEPFVERMTMAQFLSRISPGSVLIASVSFIWHQTVTL